MLNGDFDHFQEDTAELLPEKEVRSFTHEANHADVHCISPAVFYTASCKCLAPSNDTLLLMLRVSNLQDSAFETQKGIYAVV